MAKKQTTKTFRLNAIFDGSIIVVGKVSFSPAPHPGILTEVAKFEAQRIFEHQVKEDIASGRL
jgi:hypothetical protein